MQRLLGSDDKEDHQEDEEGLMPMEISLEDRGQWRNIWCILRSLDWHEISGGSYGLSIGDWGKFRSDPHGYLIRADDSQADAIWAAVEKRLK